MFLSRDNRELAARVGGRALVLLGLAGLMLGTWRFHRLMVADACDPYTDLDPGACEEATHLTHFMAWDNWFVAFLYALMASLAAVLAVMGLGYLTLGKWLRMWERYDKGYVINRVLREDYLCAMGVMAIIDVVLLAFLGASMLISAVLFS